MAADVEGKMTTTWTTLVEAALQVLLEPDPVVKAQLGELAATQWQQGLISLPYAVACPHVAVDDGDPSVHDCHHHKQKLQELPDRPARLPTVKLVPSQQMPKLGKGGSLRSRQAILHSLVHTESWAIDLSWDIIARFGKQESMPIDFFTDFVKVAQDEGRHFTLLAARLKELDSFYGAFPAHDGLWDSAIQTSESLLARLAVEHCVHEGRGLDVLPSTISRFRNAGDEPTAALLETVVYPEEITHCAAGVKWFTYLCLRRFRNPSGTSPASGGADGGCVEEYPEELAKEIDEDQQADLVIKTFHATVRRHFRGPLKPPFNEEARRAAGFEPEWYEPLTAMASEAS